MVLVLMAAAMFVLSVVSGMAGIGVAFAAVPLLSLVLADLVHEVQPLSLALNGLTAAAAAVAFARARLILWREALILSLASTLAAPIGAALAASVDATFLWIAYIASALFLGWRLLAPAAATPAGMAEGRALTRVAVLALPIGVLAGLLGVGSGFLLVPVLVMAGYGVAQAAAINAVAVTPSSFAALLPHMSTMQVAPAFAATMIAAGVAGAFLGGRLTSGIVPAHLVQRVLAILILAAAAYQLLRLLAG